MQTRTECIVNLSFDACLPERYVKAATQRMALYKRISLITSEYDVADMTDELIDRYGDLPPAAQNLLQIALIRSLAERAGVTQIRQDGGTVYIAAAELELDVWMQLAKEFPGKLRMLMSATPSIRYQIEKGKQGLAGLKTLFLRYDEIKKGSKT